MIGRAYAIRNYGNRESALVRIPKEMGDVIPTGTRFVAEFVQEGILLRPQKEVPTLELEAPDWI